MYLTSQTCNTLFLAVYWKERQISLYVNSPLRVGAGAAAGYSPLHCAHLFYYTTPKNLYEMFPFGHTVVNL